MQSSFHSGRQLPGWGSELRKPLSTTRRTALMLATVAGLAISGCSGGTPTTPTPSTSASPSVSVQSQPGRLKGALALAMRHLDSFQMVASNPYHLVGFRGRALDDNGATTANPDSTWEFTFSRYADPTPAQRYDVVTVTVPGTGNTSAIQSQSTDVALSPVESWDNATDASTPDSPDFLAPLKNAGAKLAGAIVTFSQGKVIAEAGGKSVIYDVSEGTYSEVR